MLEGSLLIVANSTGVLIHDISRCPKQHGRGLQLRHATEKSASNIVMTKNLKKCNQLVGDTPISTFTDSLIVIMSDFQSNIILILRSTVN